MFIHLRYKRIIANLIMLQKENIPLCQKLFFIPLNIRHIEKNLKIVIF